MGNPALGIDLFKLNSDPRLQPSRHGWQGSFSKQMLKAV